MANTPNSGERSGERQRRQQQPGSQQAGGRPEDGRERERGAERKSAQTGRDPQQQTDASSAASSGQVTRDKSNWQAGSGWEDEESLRSNRRNEADDAMRARGGAEETGEDEDLPTRPERRGPDEERTSR